MCDAQQEKAEKGKNLFFLAVLRVYPAYEMGETPPRFTEVNNAPTISPEARHVPCYGRT
jgi:hypothetical protein